MAERYGILVTTADGEQEVSNIAVMEGGPPDVRTGSATVVKVGDGVKIGMIKGGPIDAADGYGFRDGTAGQTAKPDKEDKAPAKRGRPAKVETEA